MLNKYFWNCSNVHCENKSTPDSNFDRAYAVMQQEGFDYWRLGEDTEVLLCKDCRCFLVRDHNLEDHFPECCEEEDDEEDSL